jgi:uncharacterized protein
VGFHHWRNGNHHGASVLLEEGIGRLAPFAPVCQGVDVAALVRDASAARAELLRLGPEGMAGFDLDRAPRVRLTGPYGFSGSSGVTGS